MPEKSPSPETTVGGASGGSGSGVSFGFARKSAQTNKLVTSGLREKSTLSFEPEKDFVKEISEKRGLESSKPKATKAKALVIPCKGNKYKFDLEAKAKAAQKAPERSAEDLAAERELVEESRLFLEEGTTGDDAPRKNDNLTVALSQEDKEKAILDTDLESRAEVSTLDDYDAIPVEGFGMGMLRGMGFKLGEGIGGFKKAHVQCLEPDVRPKGLGLGAQRPNVGGENGAKKSSSSNEDLTMKKGAHVVVERGAHRGSYGKVEGLDEETARVVVKLSVGGDSISISENVVRVVTRDEYKKYSKVINKDEYEKYAKKQEERQMEWETKKHTEKSEKNRERSRSPVKSSSYTKSPRDSWLQPHLRVRLIHKDYGKYYNSKVIVEDVVSPYSCVVRTESGRVLDNVDPRDCETVIPKKDQGIIMIVRGKRKGKIGEILGRDKRNSEAAIQVLPDKDEVLKLDYDDICEFVGDVDLYT